MALYYLPVLIRSDRYFVTRLEQETPFHKPQTDFNFVIHAGDRVFTPILTLEDPAKIALNQMEPGENQDVPLKECHLSLVKENDGFKLLIKKNSTFKVEPFYDEETGMRLDYSSDQRRIVLGYYRQKVNPFPFLLTIIFEHHQQE